MERIVERHDGREWAYYRLDVTAQMRGRALGFARELIEGGNQYSRLLPGTLRARPDAGRQQRLEIQRTYLGKLGELVFLQFLKEKGKQADTAGMFDIYAGEENVDRFDFATAAGETVDVKTGFRPIHKRLLVNVEQFNSPRLAKDYYVAVWLKARDTDAAGKLVDWEDIPFARIHGYAEHSYMQRHAGVRDFGEGDARWLFYGDLKDIDRLVEKF